MKAIKYYVKSKLSTIVKTYKGI